MFGVALLLSNDSKMYPFEFHFMTKNISACTPLGVAAMFSFVGDLVVKPKVIRF